MHSGKPNPRHEKNRHHLVTFLCALAGIALLFLLQNTFGPAHHSIVWTSGLLYVAVFVGRTVFVELGLRRQPSSCELQMEESGRRAMQRHFGIVAIEETSEELNCSAGQ